MTWIPVSVFHHKNGGTGPGKVSAHVEMEEVLRALQRHRECLSILSKADRVSNSSSATACLSVCQRACLCVSMPVCVSACLSVCQRLCLCVSVFICVSVCLSVCCLFVCPFVSMNSTSLKKRERTLAHSWTFVMILLNGFYFLQSGDRYHEDMCTQSAFSRLTDCADKISAVFLY